MHVHGSVVFLVLCVLLDDNASPLAAMLLLCLLPIGC